MSALAVNTIAAQNDQHSRAQQHRPFRPELPGDHRCPTSNCSIPPPPLPPGIESFDNTPRSDWMSLFLIAGIGLTAFIYLNNTQRK